MNIWIEADRLRGLCLIRRFSTWLKNVLCKMGSMNNELIEWNMICCAMAIVNRWWQNTVFHLTFFPYLCPVRSSAANQTTFFPHDIMQIWLDAAIAALRYSNPGTGKESKQPFCCLSFIFMLYSFLLLSSLAGNILPFIIWPRSTDWHVLVHTRANVRWRSAPLFTFHRR